MYTLHLNSDAGYAVLPLTLLGAPVSIRVGEALGVTSYGRGVTELIIIMMRRTREVVSKEVGEEERGAQG